MSAPDRRAFRRASLALLVAVALAAPATSSGAPAGKRAPAKRAPSVIVADVDEVVRAIHAPGASAVLVNVWATWCDPCRAEMPRLVRFYRAHAAEGLRLVLVSADDEHDRADVARFLGSQGVDFTSWIKRGDDMAFINAIEPTWTGAIPASFLYTPDGRLGKSWRGEVTTDDLERGLAELGKPIRKEHSNDRENGR